MAVAVEALQNKHNNHVNGNKPTIVPEIARDTLSQGGADQLLPNQQRAARGERPSEALLDDNTRLDIGLAWGRIARGEPENHQASDIMKLADLAANAPGAIAELQRLNKQQDHQQPWPDVEGQKRADNIMDAPPIVVFENKSVK